MKPPSRRFWPARYRGIHRLHHPGDVGLDILTVPLVHDPHAPAGTHTVNVAPVPGTPSLPAALVVPTQRRAEA